MNKTLLFTGAVLALALLAAYAANVGAQQPNSPLPLTKDGAIRLATATAKSWGESNPRAANDARSTHQDF